MFDVCSNAGFVTGLYSQLNFLSRIHFVLHEYLLDSLGIAEKQCIFKSYTDGRARR